jgi:hypothetical protein
MGIYGVDASGSGLGSLVSCEYGNESGGSIIGGEFLDYLSDY